MRTDLLKIQVWINQFSSKWQRCMLVWQLVQSNKNGVLDMQGNVFIFVRYKKSQQRSIITSFLAVLKSGVLVILCQTWNRVSKLQTLKHSITNIYKLTIKDTPISFYTEFMMKGKSYHISIAFHHVSASSLLSCNKIIFFPLTLFHQDKTQRSPHLLTKSNVWYSFSHDKSYLSSLRKLFRWACLSIRSSFLLDLSDY